MRVRSRGGVAAQDVERLVGRQRIGDVAEIDAAHESLPASYRTSSRQSGLPADLAYRSQTALTTAAVARWMTPFSGPTQRSWLSPVIMRQNAPISAVNDSSVLPTTSGLSAWIAATHSSLPRPIVKVRPCPSNPGVGVAARHMRPSSPGRDSWHRSHQLPRGREADVARDNIGDVIGMNKPQFIANAQRDWPESDQSSWCYWLYELPRR